eukprot:TRINITY_DN10757_c0_g1_i2.p1 TRINITY_DN10757_c0_g1~~TRINITY_DN10757_c0_g1_i2.p1  ORF type:complete len:206 (+),score=32.85 TRINITY_DN10757_c0_g1_i2:49-618(+)
MSKRSKARGKRKVDEYDFDSFLDSQKTNQKKLRTFLGRLKGVHVFEVGTVLGNTDSATNSPTHTNNKVNPSNSNTNNHNQKRVQFDINTSNMATKKEYTKEKYVSMQCQVDEEEDEKEDLFEDCPLLIEVEMTEQEQTSQSKGLLWELTEELNTDTCNHRIIESCQMTDNFNQVFENLNFHPVQNVPQF